MSYARVPCSLCGQQIDPEAPSTYVRREVYTNENRRRGANAVFLPGPALGCACASCCERVKLHIPVGQASLLEVEA